MAFVSHLERFGKAQGLEEGRLEGMQEGRQEGLRQGQATQLLRLLQLKFGKLPAELTQRVRRADEAQVGLWAERLLFAARLEDVFCD